MVTIEKGAPVRPPQTNNGSVVRELAEAAYSDKGEWFSVERPPDMVPGSVHNLVNQAVTRLSAEVSTKGGRVWIRFF